MSVQIVNNAPGVRVDREEGDEDSRGRRQEKFVISEVVDTGIATPGGRASKTLATGYGLRRLPRSRS